MRFLLFLATTVTLATLSACNSDSHLAPELGQLLSTQQGALVVDDDGADCPHADFNSIQAAVLTAQPGSTILVCRGIYPEEVLAEKADLRIQAQGAPGDVVLQGTAAQRYGFHVRNTTGVLVEGFTVQGYADANIIIDGGSGNTLRKNVATAGVIDGIEVLASSSNVIEHNVAFANASPNADGIFVWQGAADNVIRHNETFDNGQHGINLFGSGTGNVLFGNGSHHNGVRGIQSVLQSNGTVIENNDIFENGLTPVPGVVGVGVGILVANSSEVIVRNNRSENNGSNGIALNGASRTLVRGNRTEGNRANGIVLNGASDNLVETNEVLGNAQDGIAFLNNADRNIVQSNNVMRHGRDGVRVNDAASEGNTIARNVIRESSEHDAHDDSVGSGTAATANFWLQNHCETQNRAGLCEHPRPTLE